MSHPNQRNRFIVALTGLVFAGAFAPTVQAGPTSQPQPIGSSTMSISYTTTAGNVMFSGLRTHDGTGPGDVAHLTGAPNVGAFSAHNALGRRPASAQGADETLMRHGFYKFGSSGFNIAADFFQDMTPGSDITIAIENVQFDRPVQIQEDTALLHILWDIDQVDSLGLNGENLPRSYVNPNNHHTVANLRDVAEFQNQNVFRENPEPNYVIGDIAPSFWQPQPDVVSVSLTFPYEMFRHSEDDGLGVPAGLPGPGGFLEPFHFHLEYLVVPEPSAGLLLAVGGLVIRRRR